MSDRFIRCPHCGLPHDAHIRVCPTTGLRVEAHERVKKRRRGVVSREREREQRAMVGRVVERKYRIIGAVGEGGMSSIYEAVQVNGNRRVALKVLHPSLADDREAIARLKQEAKVVSTIGHANICEIFDLGRTEDGSPYLVMELLEGESLAERIKADERMSFYDLAPIVKQVLAALAAAHGKGILHRDLKPENVFIEQGQRRGQPVAKLLDFGISKTMTYDFVDSARLTHSGMVMGTPYYMAPEQARGDSGLDQRVDLWAVGVVMYEALTGRRPFVATNYNALLVKILTSRPRPAQKLVPSLPEPVVAVVDRALSKLREDRFQSAQAFIEAIQRVERSVTVEDPAAPTMMFRRPRRAPEPPPPKPPIGAEGYAARPSNWSRTIEDGDAQGYPSPPQPAVTQPGTAPPGGSQSPQNPSVRRRRDVPPAVASVTQIDEPLEVTIQDRIPSFLDEEEGAEGTQVMRPEELPGGDGIPDVEVAPDSSHGTEVITRHEIEERSAPPVSATPTQLHRPQKSRHKKEPKKRKRKARDRPLGPPGTAPRPPVPRPRAPEDDEEKTTLFDIDAARAALERRRRESEEHE